MTPLPLRADDGATITNRATRQLVILSTRPELTITWSRHSPGEAGTELHVHREHVDAFYVLDGELTFRLGAAGEPVRLGAGSFVAVPPHVVHAFRNESGAGASWLNFHAPDKGFADYLRGAPSFDSFDPPAEGGRPRSEAIVAAPLGEVEVPGLRVAARQDQGADFRFEHGGGVVDITAPTG